jgi:hypothetical protein
MNKHTAILPDGNVAKRNSKTRVYTHCVAIKWLQRHLSWKEEGYVQGADNRVDVTDDDWGVYGWNGRYDLAVKLAERLSAPPKHKGQLKCVVQILEVEVSN